jgi:Ca-activated chloride channel family protein
MTLDFSATSFQFANPWILILALAVPALLAAYHLLARRGAKPATMHHPATGLMQGLPRSRRATWRPITTVMRVLAITLMIIGLARLQFVQGRETITGEGVDIALALDISGSMASLDFEPQNRLQASKQVINDFIMERPYDRIGLVIFSNEAFSQSPLTLDHNMVSR